MVNGLYFNSRTHKGCDSSLMLVALYIAETISIHAPIKDATNRRQGSQRLCYYFNSRTHKGCDKFLSILHIVQVNFNSRTHKGCDVLNMARRSDSRISIHAPIKDATCPCVARWVSIGDFNSRTHKGCDCNP